MPRTLVVYYSRTGNTRLVAEKLAQLLGADLEAIVDPTPRRGLLGFLRCGFQAVSGATPDIREAAHDPATYDAVLVGSPVWAARLSSPVRTYLQRHRRDFKSVAFFVTCGRDSDRALRQMAQASGCEPEATLAIVDRELTAPGLADRLGAFARRALAPAPAEPEPAAHAAHG